MTLIISPITLISPLFLLKRKLRIKNKDKKRSAPISDNQRHQRSIPSCVFAVQLRLR
jgi:hypothetical protein